MADEKKPEAKPEDSSFFSHPDPFVEIVLMLLGLFMAVYVINGIASYFSSGSFTILGFTISSNHKVIPLSKMDSILGHRVETVAETAVYNSPGVNQTGIEPVEARGVIIEGPMINGSIRYWHVRFEDGVEGWVDERNLNYIEKSPPVPLSSVSSLIGADILTSKDGVIIYNNPGGREIGKVNKDTAGKIIEGPIISGGVKYWHIRFADEQDGWVRESDLNYVDGSAYSVKVSGFIAKLFLIFKFLSVLISIILGGFVILLFKRVVASRKEEASKYYLEKREPETEKNLQWGKIQNNLESQSESDWRLSILEADIILDTLLDNLGLVGETVADKLKTVEKSDFTTIDNAWEAHKIRNRIAHEGGFVLSQREAKRVVMLYQSVFEEFRII